MIEFKKVKIGDKFQINTNVVKDDFDGGTNIWTVVAIDDFLTKMDFGNVHFVVENNVKGQRTMAKGNLKLWEELPTIMDLI